MKAPNARKLQGDQTRARIQDAATKLFVSQGFAGTSISAIATTLGLTKAALYAHFASKDDLLMSLINRWETDFLDVLIAEVLSTPGDALAKLNHLVTFHAKSAAENRDLCLLLGAISPELQGADGRFGKELRRLHDARIRFVARLVEEGKAQGVFDADLDARNLAHVILAFHNGMLLEWHRAAEILDGQEFTRTFRRVLLLGVRAGHHGMETNVKERSAV